MSSVLEMRAVHDRLEKVRSEMDEVLKDARVVARKAREEGYSISAIAISLGVTRQTIYNFIAEENEG